ncbi:PREDICTED: chymotrypsin-2-like [Ceratosolen solmsi marchali]|uniref:Chymotrypsin-2-like n=1 Tax=Ceratosolen solmsi marchali TaxID=326594 RepID=A0AAJ6VMZ7_9HYME|nr:PREDICTED: chymotrypsin-2-like [Ceratosolen solmsi marchali]
MKLHISLLFIQLIFLNQYEFVHSKALIGRNVRDAMTNEFPFVVAIKRFNNTNPNYPGDLLCTGTIISSQYVLTAAQRVLSVSVHNLEVIFGSNDIRSTQRLKVARLISFLMWAYTKHITVQESTNDICLLKLAGQIPNNIQPVIMSPMPYANLYRHKVITAGWGMTNVNYPQFLQTSSVVLLEPKKCKNQIENLTQMPTDMHLHFLCTSSTPSVLLRDGDSGGPLLFAGELIGINKESYPVSDDNFLPKTVNLHLKIDYYRHFIVDTINTL